MTNIRIIKDRKEYDSLDSWWEDIQERVKEIKQFHINRKKKLLEYNNESLIKMEELLKNADLYFKRERSFFSEIGDLFYADFFINELNTCIEIDGEYHNEEKRKYLDHKKEIFLAERGIVTIRIKNDEVLNISKLDRKFFLKEGEKFWKRVKENVRDFKECKKKWEVRQFEHHDYTKKQLSLQFKERLKDVCKDCEVEEYRPNGEIVWKFKDIFEAHLKTGIKFKNIFDKFVIKTNNWKTKFRFKEK